MDDQRLVGTSDRHLSEVCKSEGRIFVTLDLDFADIRTYPPDEHPGIIVLRLACKISLTFLTCFGER